MAKVGGSVSSLREQQRGYTRERLVRGGAEVFERKGYLAATVDDIAGAAGASRATFYLHFRTKSEVLVELGSRLVPQVHELYAALDLVLETGTRAAMREWMEDALSWMETNRAVMAAADAAAVLEGPNDPLLADPFIASMPRLLARWPDSRRREAGTRITLLVAQFRALFTFPVPGVGAGDSERAHDALVDAMTDVWLAGLKPPVASV